MKNSFFDAIENSRIKFKEAALALFSICTLRNIEEAVLNHRQILDNPSSEWRTWITVFFHYNFFWLLIFGLLVLLLYVLTKRNNTILNTLKIGLFATPIILLPPILNLLLGDNGGIGYPNNPLKLIDGIPHFLNPHYIIQGVTIGMRWEILIAGLATAWYVFHKTKKALLSLLGFLATCLIILLTGSLVPILAQCYEHGFHFSNDFMLSTSTLFHNGHIFQTASQRIALLYIFLTTILALIVLRVFDKNLLRTVFGNLRLTRVLHYLVLFIGGFLLTISWCEIDALETEHSHGWMDHMANPMDYFGLFMAALSLFMAFEGAVVVNDLYDVRIDTMSSPNRPLVHKAIGEKRFATIGNLLFFGSISIAFCVSESFLFLILSFILLSCVYSMPPFRCRNSLLLSNFILSLEAVIAFAAGSCVYVQSSVFSVVPDNVLLSILLAYFCIIPIKDIKDYQGDKENRVRTLLTLFGPKTGFIITIALVCLVIVGLPFLMGIHNMGLISAVFVVLFLVLQVLSYKKVLGMSLCETMTFLLYFCYVILLFFRVA